MTTPRTLILATRNQGKVRELRDPLARFGFDVQSLPEDFPEIEENGTTFEENALIKARAVAEALGVAAAADDSGLEVDALGGAPGVYSARYSEDWPAVEGESKDERNNRKLLAELEGVPAEKRTARFRCCMALVIPGGEEIVVSGAWEGSIGFKRAGANGFGYDPLFIDPELELTGAELTREAKMVRSHRGKALARLLAEVEERGL
ncbi:MAG: RdgB/HAM1 family non-canonical purine NTP pyrophosphatase [Mailhella sp.]|nr:RdgB/HAM1 family non-canonical purine NTP pyrophosphatase [Mailhella sp.]MBQ3171223.1 RdgB/HAM1 family non-canonical purine NTP pyrophosphatase [Mailhella sp.]MBQ4615741.1 RdgB/HAM1 family non-canonical purine NTP pyrophosphatase [Mailhella sp.]